MPDLMLFHDSGTSDMGSLTAGRYSGNPQVLDSNYAARWLIEEPDMAISSLRVHFVTVPGEGGAGVADLVIRVDSHRGEAFDYTLWSLGGKGIGDDVNFRVPNDQLDHFYVEQGDSPVLTWTSPDDGKIQWGATLAMVRRTRTDAI